ncbi:hypothetical protein Fot_24331 [Forsythia ovata]|uniref:Uncharacterized protein n=1 Tax=Forsythia ovata TaxID=205694 RepID=A0ABD1U5X7_9LAMI
MKELRKSNRVSSAPYANLRQLCQLLQHLIFRYIYSLFLGNSPHALLVSAAYGLGKILDLSLLLSRADFRPSLGFNEETFSLSSSDDVNLSLPENCPSKVGLKSIMSRANVVDSKNHIVQYNASNVKPLEDKLPSILQIDWKCPPKFALKKEWCVAAGEESECVRGQMPWEMLKPVVSAIPSRPSVSSDVEGKYYDDSHIPQIPIISIEEAAEAQLNGLAQVNSCTVSERPPVLKGQSISETPNCNLPISQKQPANEISAVDLVHDLKDSDLVSAATAAAAVASILRSKEQGSKVDTGLLIEFLRDPKMTWKLIYENKHGANVKTGPRAGREQITSVPLPSST